jgi:hypothetical protein
MKIVDRHHFDFSKTYYLGGPITGYPDFNNAAFGETEKQLVAEGIKVVCPHGIISGPMDESAWRTLLRTAIKRLLECDGLILMRGFISSRGALVEHSIAVALDMPVYFIDGNYLIPLHDPAKGK